MNGFRRCSTYCILTGMLGGVPSNKIFDFAIRGEAKGYSELELDGGVGEG